MAASQGRQQSRAVISQSQLHAGSAAHEASEHQQQAAAASSRLQDNDRDSLRPSAAPQDSNGRQIGGDDVPGPPPGSPPAAHGSMGEQAGGQEQQTAALFTASHAEGGPVASRDSKQDSDSDSDVLFSHDPESMVRPFLLQVGAAPGDRQHQAQS